MSEWKKAISLSLVFVLCCAVFSRAVAGSLPPQATVATATSPAPVIVLDAGHGGEDGGAVGVNGVLEKDLNLAYTDTLADLLSLVGLSVVKTRTTDQMLCGEVRSHKKRADLQNRLAIANSTPAAVLVSLHMNTYPLPDCEGLQVWYSRNTEDSRLLADRIQANTQRLFQPENKRQSKPAGANIYLLRHAAVPAILVECGFLSSPAECEKLCSDSYRLDLCVLLFLSLAENFAV